jgi:universal stress protein E
MLHRPENLGEILMEERKFLVVVDPARREHRSINWMVQIAQQQRKEKVGIHLFIGFESGDKSDPDAPLEVVKDPGWFEELFKPLNEAGIDFTAEVVWTTQWRHSVIEAARRSGAGTIMLARSAAEHQRGLITDSKWGLVREAHVPVVIVSRDSRESVNVILAAVNMQSKDPHYEDLNRDVLERGFQLAGYYDAEFHVVNAYRDSEDFPDRTSVQRVVDIPRENIHRDMGKPEDVIASVAEKVGADLVVLGKRARKGIRASLRGHTSEKVLEKISADILVLN